MNTNSSEFNFTDSFTGCDGEGDYLSCCSSLNPCGVAEGDCDYDDDCLGHLLCGTDNCLSPFSSTADCCYDPYQGEQRICCMGRDSFFSILTKKC